MIPVVYLAKIPEIPRFSRVYPTKRQEYIDAASSVKTRAERYCVWKLLEFALKDAFSLELSSLKVSQMPGGKWIAEGVEISLSHSDGYVCVCVCDEPVGVDILRPNGKINYSVYEFITTAVEREYFGERPGAEKIAEIFSVKESVFKRDGVYKTIKACFSINAGTKTVFLDRENLILTVAGGDKNSESDFLLKKVDLEKDVSSRSTKSVVENSVSGKE